MQVKLIFITFNVNCSFCQKAVKTYVKFLVIKFVLNRIQADFQFFDTHQLSISMQPVNLSTGLARNGKVSSISWGYVKNQNG